VALPSAPERPDPLARPCAFRRDPGAAPVDVVEAYLGHIEAHEPKLQAFVDRWRRPTTPGLVISLDLCALSLPNSFARDGLPISLQIVCRSYDEATALRIGWAYQDATDWHIRRPPE